MVSRSFERLDEAAAGIDGETHTFEADTADLDRLAVLPGEVAEKIGGQVEILVTNTGGPPAGGALERSTDEWEGAYRELVLAPRALIEAVLPGMRASRWGRIVNVGSSSTIEAIPHLALSNSHRMAAIGYFKTLAREVAGDGVTMNTVATGKIATDRIASMSGSMEAAREMARRDVPAGFLIPENANTWVSHIFDYEKNPDGTFTYRGATGDFNLGAAGRSAIDVYETTLPAPPKPRRINDAACKRGHWGALMNKRGVPFASEASCRAYAR
jgi:3-oxoacyl-[acyl-carrier protein] reductase